MSRAWAAAACERASYVAAVLGAAIVLGVAHSGAVDAAVYAFRRDNVDAFARCAREGERDGACRAVLRAWTEVPVSRGCLVIGRARPGRSRIALIACRRQREDEVVAAYSASKWVGAALVWRKAQALDLDFEVEASELDPTWARGAQRGLRLSHLVGLSSGLACGDLDGPTVLHPPGEVFDYCGDNFNFALTLLCGARDDTCLRAEVDAFVGRFGPGLTFDTPPFSERRLDVSLAASARAYARFLEAFTNGSVVSAPLLGHMHHEYTPIADPSRSQYVGYAQGNWRERGNVSSSIGTGGFLPWWNHDEEYFGVVAIDVLDEWMSRGPLLVAFVLAALLCVWMPVGRVCAPAVTPRTLPRSFRGRARL